MNALRDVTSGLHLTRICSKETAVRTFVSEHERHLWHHHRRRHFAGYTAAAAAAATQRCTADGAADDSYLDGVTERDVGRGPLPLLTAADCRRARSGHLANDGVDATHAGLMQVGVFEHRQRRIDDFAGARCGILTINWWRRGSSSSRDDGGRRQRRGRCKIVQRDVDALTRKELDEPRGIGRSASGFGRGDAGEISGLIGNNDGFQRLTVVALWRYHCMKTATC